ncbi:MAG: NAD-dependent epimerase/dehydratase family protein [Pirellula sp.]
MKVIITGGGGFLGVQLCKKLLDRPQLTSPKGTVESVEEIVLFDARLHNVPDPLRHPTLVEGKPKVVCVEGSIDDVDSVRNAIGTDPHTSVFHLASMVSGECEERFDDALRINLDGGRNIFEAVRAIPGLPRLVFASSIACFGGEAMQPPCDDRTKLTPETTYGMTKVICELLINDYSRKGFFDGRSARLPTVIIRPGKPNTAASSWASGMFREPLNGESCHLPVDWDQRHPMTGYRTVIDSLIAIHELPAISLGSDRGIGLPARSITPRLADTALKDFAIERNLRSLGPIEDRPDARIRGIVKNWPVEVDGSRGLALGLPPAPTLPEIIGNYWDDFGAKTS